MTREAWVDAALAAAGRERTGPLETFRERPWGTVWRASTTGGTVWLKAPAAATAFEVGLYAVLDEVAREHILPPLGVDVERGWVLLPDGGPTLADSVTGDARLALMERVLPQYAQMQRAVAPHADRLLALGMTDMGPAVMPARFDEALERIPDAGLGPEDRPRVRAWCEALAASPVPVSLDHNDLHGANILPTADGTVRFYDWGDAVVAHPFASMLMGLGVMTGHVLHCPPEDPRILRLRDAYLEPFSDLAPHAALVRDLELACRVGKVARALIWLRAVEGRPDVDPYFATAPAESLVAVRDASYLTGA